MVRACTSPAAARISMPGSRRPPPAPGTPRRLAARAPSPALTGSAANRLTMMSFRPPPTTGQLPNPRDQPSPPRPGTGHGCLVTDEVFRPLTGLHHHSGTGAAIQPIRQQALRGVVVAHRQHDPDGRLATCGGVRRGEEGRRGVRLIAFSQSEIGGGMERCIPHTVAASFDTYHMGTTREAPRSCACSRDCSMIPMPFSTHRRRWPMISGPGWVRSWYWTVACLMLNHYADVGDIITCTRLINGWHQWPH